MSRWGMVAREGPHRQLNAVEARANSTESELLYCQEQVHGLQQSLEQECTVEG